MTTADTQETRLVVFRLDANRYAVELARVERVVRRVALTPLPQAPEIVPGVLDVAGVLVPAVDVRRRFRLPSRLPAAEDQFLIVHTARRRLAMVVDEVLSVATVPAAQVTSPGSIVPGLEFLSGILQLPGSGIVLIHDVDAFLSLDDEARLAAALEEGGGP